MPVRKKAPEDLTAKKALALEVIRRLKAEYPDAGCTLDYDHAWQLLVSVRLADNRRLCVATPRYLQQHGTPQHPRDLARHDCLSLDPQRGWVFSDPDTPGQTRTIKVSGRFECNDGTVLHDWAVGGIGLAWRSMWEVERDLAEGRLVSVLDNYAAPPTGIYAVFPQNRRLPLRVRLLRSKAARLMLVPISPSVL